MKNIRIIARLDIKGDNLIKGINLEGLRVIGDPNTYARNYYDQGIDELIYIDAVASLYGRNSLTHIIEYTAQNIFVPFTVGGGIRTVNDVDSMLRAGADKVAINTAAVHRPELIREVAQRFGSQCMVVSIEAKHRGEANWEVYTDNGRERTHMDVLEWAKHAASLGAGEILLTSVDQEGTRLGFDCQLIKTISENVSIPVIASGGFGKLEHFKEAVISGNTDAIAVADAFHYNRLKLSELREYAHLHSIPVRTQWQNTSP